MNINPFIDFIASIISLYNMALFIWIIVFWLVYFDIINKNQPIVRNMMNFLGQIIEPSLRLIRKAIPTFSGIDLSPVVLILLLRLLNNILFTYFYK